jgi:hypothetical protein
VGHLMTVTWVHCSLPPAQFNVFKIGENLKPPEGSGIPFAIDFMATLTVNGSQIAKRRSSRIALNTRTGLSGQDRQKCSFTMPARATNLNRHGAAVQINRELVVGSIVVLRHSRGTQISARVVARVGANQGVPTYGIEFVETDERATNFWGITFPSNG